MAVCYFCNINTVPLPNNQEYNKCIKCGTVIVNSESNGAQYDSDDMVSLYASRIDRYTKRDVGHYSKLTGYSWFKDFKNKHSFDTIFALGGGFPKLESYLNTKKIISYDMMQELYASKSDIFLSNYPTENKEIIFEKQCVNADFIKGLKAKQTDMISFVHILEHFKQETIIDFLDAVPTNVPVLIYGPEITSAGNRGNWYHFRKDEHLTLFSIDYLTQYLKEKFAVNIIFRCKYVDDMFFVFSKK
jgi:hypothetical protein